MKATTEKAVLVLPLIAVEPDQSQVRTYLDEREGLRPLRDAIERWGQLHPIRVRKKTAGGYVIVDGERRYRALCQLDRIAKKKDAADERFSNVLALEGADVDEDATARRAIQAVSNMGADLLPAEKAQALAAVKADFKREKKRITQAELAKMFGIPKGQARYLLELSCAPAFLLELGKPKSYEVLKPGTSGVGEDEEGNVETETVERPPLSVALLRELHLAFKKLVELDRRAFDEDPEHKPQAATVIKRLGIRAQREEWSRKVLRAEIGKALGTKSAAAKKETSPGQVFQLIDRLERQLEKTDLETLPDQEQQDLRARLAAMLSGLAPDRRTQARREALGFA